MDCTRRAIKSCLPRQAFSKGPNEGARPWWGLPRVENKNEEFLVPFSCTKMIEGNSGTMAPYESLNLPIKARNERGFSSPPPQPRLRKCECFVSAWVLAQKSARYNGTESFVWELSFVLVEVISLVYLLTWRLWARAYFTEIGPTAPSRLGLGSTIASSLTAETDQNLATRVLEPAKRFVWCIDCGLTGSLTAELQH